MPRMCFSKQCMHVNQSVFIIFFLVFVFFFLFFSGCGYSRLALSALKVMKTSSSNEKGEENKVLRRDRERVLLKVVIREGNSVPLSPAFARPSVCFKLLQALQPSLSKRVSVRHLERGKGEGGLFLPFVCVCGKRNDMEFGFPHSFLNP